jgi:uridine kinase
MENIAFGSLLLYLSSVVVYAEFLKHRKSGKRVISVDEAIKSSDPVTPPTSARHSQVPHLALTSVMAAAAAPSVENPKQSNSESSSGLLMLSPATSNAKLVAPIVNRIDTTSEKGGIIVIGIAGGSGSGKTTLARAIYDAIGAENISFISHDSYYKDLSHLAIEEREKQNFDHPDSLDTALLVQHVISLKNGQDVDVPTYDFKTHSRTKATVSLSARPVILVEGILIFTDPALYELVDIRIFVDTDDDIRLIRRLERDTVERGRTLNSVIHQYIQTVRPMHLQYVEPSKRNADIIVPVGLNSVALDLVVSKLKSHLSDF